MRITASQRKLIASLSSARGRRETGLFAAEGIRCVSELLPSFRLHSVVVTSAWLDAHGGILESLVGYELPDDRLLVARNDEMSRISSMMTPQGLIAVFELPASKSEKIEIGDDELVLALDRIQDPGNLGTIIRVADWFGVKNVLASEDTVDVFNPKVLQSTMGALARVDVVYCDLPAVLREMSEKGITVYGTFLEGENIYRMELGGGVVVMGNEGNGISPEISSLIERRITIPSFPAGSMTVESLNVGTATAVTVAEFRRQSMMSGIS